MIKIFKTYFLVLFVCCFTTIFGYNTDANGIVLPMSPPRLVNDYANLLSSSQQQVLNNKLLDYNNSTSTQIYVVTIDSLNDYAIEDYALRLGRNWAIGQRNKNNGVLILLSKSDRKVDIEIGYGLESYITDYDSKRIIDEILIPAFKNQNYYSGLDNATNRIIALADGSFTKDNDENNSTIPTIWIIAFIILMIYLMIKFPNFTRIVFIVLSSSGSSSGSSRGFGGGGGGSFGGGGSSGSW